MPQIMEIINTLPVDQVCAMSQIFMTSNARLSSSATVSPSSCAPSLTVCYMVMSFYIMFHHLVLV